MPKFEFIPEPIKKPLRKVRAAADQSFLRYAKTEGEIRGDPWKIILDTKQGKFIRTQALFSVLRDMIPDRIFHTVTGERYVFQNDQIAIDPEQYELEEGRIGAGYECTVYKLASRIPDRPSLVLKVDHTGTENVDVLLERGKQVRAEWEMIKGWYQDVPGFVPDEFYFIGQSPIGGRNALFTIQEYFGTKDELRDFFHDVTDERLLIILKRDPTFRENFITFAQVTLDRAEQYDELIDTYGENNLVFAEREEGSQLILLDPHVVKHPKGTEVIHERETMRHYLRYLRDMLAKAEAMTAPIQETNLSHSN